MSKKRKGRIGVVYSTDPDYEYEHTATSEAETLPPAQQNLKVRLETKQRKGKKVTVVDSFIGRSADLEALGKRLKTQCGTGGAVKAGQILLQGDKRDRVIELLKALGYKCKKAGG